MTKFYVLSFSSHSVNKFVGFQQMNVLLPCNLELLASEIFLPDHLLLNYEDLFRCIYQLQQSVLVIDSCDSYYETIIHDILLDVLYSLY